MRSEGSGEFLPQETEPVGLAWIIARVLFFIIIFALIAWSTFGAVAEDVRFQLRKNAQRTSGQRWDKELGDDRAVELMSNAAHFVQSQLYSSPEAPRKTVKNIILTWEEKMSIRTVTIENVIYINSAYIENFQENAALEMEALIYKAMAYVWIWDGKGQAPLGLLDAMADFLSISAGFLPHATRIDELEQWSTWDKMRSSTGLFLQFCEATKPGFVRSLNAKLAVGWNESFFQDLMGESIEDLWTTYKLWRMNGRTSSLQE